MTENRLRVLELFCGIGGCAAAIDGRADVVAAVDINRRALAVYQHNFPHRVDPRTIESLRREEFANWSADVWWLSPPCQPYTSRGRQRDIDDPRATSLLALLDRIREVRPRYLALENVPGFAESRARARLRETLEACQYNVRELLLCPTELGVPNRRRRFYLVAARGELLPWPAIRADSPRTTFADILQTATSDSLRVSPTLLKKYDGALHVIRPSDPRAISHCFTAAYGKSITASGSYVECSEGCRRFSPEEELRLLGFPPSYSLPPYDHPRQMWPLVGNSLSVDAARFVLAAIPELVVRSSNALGEPCASS